MALLLTAQPVFGASLLMDPANAFLIAFFRSWGIRASRIVSLRCWVFFVTSSVFSRVPAFIKESIHDVNTTMIIGGLLTVFIVYLFLNSWRSTVITGLTLPANAEIIAEGFIDPNELMDEGPFGEYTGYYSGNKGKDYPKPVLRIKRILHRDDPVMWATTVGKPINDIHMIQSLNRTATLWHDLETMKVPGIQSVYFPPEATGRFWVVVSVKQMYPGHSNHVGNAVIASTTGHYGVKGVITVDHDIAADDWDRIWWALATRFDPKRSAQIIDRGRSTPLDPGLPIEAREITSRILLDACTPFEWKNKPSESFMDRTVLEKVSKRWQEYGFKGASPVADMIPRLTRPEIKTAASK